MNNEANTTPRPKTPRGRFELFELLRDGELIATGSRDQMEWDAAELLLDTDDSADAVYTVTRADLTGCAAGAAGRMCNATRHALHGVPDDERPDHLRGV